MDPIRQKLKNLVNAAAAADHERLKLRDELIEAFRVSVAGVDVTRHAQPALPPELQKKRRRRRKKK